MTARPRTKRWRGWTARCVEPAEGSHLWTKPARGWSTSAPTNASALQGGDVVGERPALPLSRAVPGLRLFQEACLEACGSHVRSQIAEPSSFLGITPQHLFVQVRADGSLQAERHARNMHPGA